MPCRRSAITATLALPNVFVSVCSCRLALETHTSSASIMVSEPMPLRANASAAHDPTPPTPTTATRAAASRTTLPAPYNRSMPANLGSLIAPMIRACSTTRASHQQNGRASRHPAGSSVALEKRVPVTQHLAAACCAARIGRRLVGHRDFRHAFFLQRSVGLGKVAIAQCVEVLRGVAEFTRDHVHAGELVVGRRTLVTVDRTIYVVEVFAQALLAGDGTTFLGGNDLLADGVGLVGQRVQLFLQGGIRPGLPCAGLGVVAYRDDPIVEIGHAAEQVADLHRGVELCLALSQCERITRIEAD